MGAPLRYILTHVPSPFFFFFKWRQNWRPRVLFPIADNIMAGGHRLNDMFVAPPQYKHHAFAAWIFSSWLLRSLKIARVECSYASIASFVTRFSGIRTNRARCRNRRTGCGTGATRTGHPITHSSGTTFMGWTTWPAPSLQYCTVPQVPVGDLSPRFYRESSPRFGGGGARRSCVILFIFCSRSATVAGVWHVMA